MGKLEEAKIREIITKEVETRMNKAHDHAMKKERLRNDANIKLKNQRIGEMQVQIEDLKEKVSQLKEDYEEL